MNIKYFFGALISIPLLPLMYYQGKRIRKNVPELPEAKGIYGKCKSNRKTTKRLNLISIGESTIAGVGVETHEEGFTGTFAKELANLLGIGINWKVYARSGYTAKRVEEKIIPKIIETQTDVILVGLGGNDAFTLNRPWKWKRQMHSLIKSIKSKFPDAIVIFCNMPPIKEFPAFTRLIKFTVGNLVEILGKELVKVVANYQNVVYFDETITLKGWINKFELSAEKEAFFSDGVHPSKLTYQTWAKDIANKVFSDENIINALKKEL